MRILAVTSGRADATPLRPVIKKLHCHTLSVEGEKFFGAARKVSEVIERFDLLLVLGDRYEILGAAGAATVAGVPIAHIHGGEASFGSFDNQIRDAVTKLAHIHFVAADHMKYRLLDLGEEYHRIHVVGAPGLDNLPRTPRHPGKYFVVTYHPETLGRSDMWKLVAALDEFPDYAVYWTGVNNDPGAESLRLLYQASRGQVVNWTAETYLHMCRNAALVIGNSSSGIIEAPSLEVPTVNIGCRQDGRLRGPSIFDCTNDRHDIENCIRVALGYDGPFDNPYGGPGASERIENILRNVDIDKVKRWRTSSRKSESITTAA